MSLLARELDFEIDKINLGETIILSIIDNASTDNPSYSFSSSNKEVAIIDNVGRVIGVASGTATITITAAATTNYQNSTVSKDITVSSSIGNEIYICFENDIWKTSFSDIITIEDGTYPFSSSNTYTYNGLKTYRSYSISHSQTSESTLTFENSQNGILEFNYRVISETNYDKLKVILDGVEIVNVSGSVNWTNKNQNLVSGIHTLTFQYSKDGSNSTSSDAGGIGFLRISGLTKPYYLFRSNETIYTISNNALTPLSVELNRNTFETYGVNNIPPAILTTLTNPEILCWTNSTPDSRKKVIVRGEPVLPQIIITNPYEINGNYIEKVNLVSSIDTLYAFSLLDKTSQVWSEWKYYDQNTLSWKNCDNNIQGVNINILQNIETNYWKTFTENSSQYKIKIILPTMSSYLTSIEVKYK